MVRLGALMLLFVLCGGMARGQAAQLPALATSPAADAPVTPLDKAPVTLPAQSMGSSQASAAIRDHLEKVKPPIMIYAPAAEVPRGLRKPCRVEVKMLVDKNGKIQDAQLGRSTNDICNESAMTVAKKYKFKPETRDGKPSDSWVLVLMDISPN